MSKTELQSGRKSTGYWVRAWWPVAVAVCVIGLESTALLGADETSEPLRWIWEHVFGSVSNAHWEIIHHYIRKSGHFLGYGTMGLLWLRAWWMTLPRARFRLQTILAVLGTAVVAGSDEFHQSFLPNRTGVFSDVILDCSGAVVLIFLAYLVQRITSLKRFPRTA